MAPRFLWECHGNVRFLANAGGTVTDSYDYDAFGILIRGSGTTPNAFSYSGERLDNSVGLYDLRARYYNQATGRFWARDPVEGKRCCGLNWNPYIYVKDNPVNGIDPTGRQALYEYLLVFQLFGIQRKEDVSAEIGECHIKGLTLESELLEASFNGEGIPAGTGQLLGNAIEPLSNASFMQRAD